MVRDTSPTGGITSFDPDDFELDTSGFANYPGADERWSVGSSGGAVQLTYVAPG